MGIKSGQKIIDYIRGKKSDPIIPIDGKRREYLNKYIKSKTKAGLEIGALNLPTLTKDVSQIHYADIVPQSEMEEHFKDYGGINFEEIVKLDYTIDSTKPVHMSFDRKFDYIIANHVFEHLPNPIAYLKSIENLLNDDGILFLTIPDKRFTFDKTRSLTTLEHLVGDYLSGAQNKDPEHLFDYFNNAAYPELPIKDVYLKLLNQLEIMDDIGNTHYHVFTVDTFGPIIKDIIKLELINYKLELLETSKDTIEFVCILRKKTNG